MAVSWERVNGGWKISRVLATPAAATAAAMALEGVVEAAFGQPFPTPEAVRELTPAQQTLAERQDEDAPLEHLKHGEAFHGTSSDSPLHALGEDAE